MSEPSNNPAPVPPGQESIDRRAWPRERQVRVAAVAAAVVILGLLGLWLGGRLFGTPAAAPVEPAAPAGTFRATPQQLKTLTLEPVSLHGFVSEEITEGKIAVNGDRTTPLFSPYSGRITRVIAGLGDTVKKGAPLATLEATEFVQAQNDLATAVAQRKLARSNETRKHALFEAKGGSLSDWQQAQADLTAAETAVYSVRNRLRILGESDARIDELESAHSINPVATISAPIAGVVVDRQVGPGQYVQAGAGTPVFTIADPSSVWLLANVREAAAGSVRAGDIMFVRVPAYPQREFRANVTYVAALVDSATHRLAVRAEIDNRDGTLKPEMFATFRIQTSDATQSPAIPEAAVVYEGDAAHVWVVQGDGLLAYRSIRTGRTNDGLVEVLEGLKTGERIVARGGLFIDQAAASGNT
jgi:cobalt-zinc-cadmium efflux system membrane fusion protein